jgi:hypothetical protein
MSADVHRKAADYLSGLLKQRQADRVVVVRQQAPKYLVGFKTSGAAVWSYSAQIAKRFDGGSVELSEAVEALRGLEGVGIVAAERLKASEQYVVAV